MKILIFIISLSAAIVARASGPIAPDGWEGSFEPTLPTGQSCCLPAKLNGTELTGGAMILISTDKEAFAIFALTYTPPLEEHWQLLEKHPISQLTSYSVFIEPAGRFPFDSIKVCINTNDCYFYYTTTTHGLLKKSSEASNVH